MAADDLTPSVSPLLGVVRAFPLDRQKGKVADVAGKMLTKTTVRHAEQYRDQVTHSILRRLEGYGLCEIERDEQLHSFWEAVQAEITRRCYAPSKGRDPRGAA
ncbi:hypothetical protein HFO58_07555 [Rhizobium leguminosarum]|uniref:DUF6074 family protein n=1 Tax=Rhizobium leguminosarum TaxID=384 RepID=UPI001C945857|nr:DUF6074 family protein [Rhizobium leguminosarum]MBY5533025.1 hypothetical protein [Rhizobium leguminosarum]